ncbi:MAG: phosphatidylglycerol lysyltransferase domain-containing protein [Gracilibacteraceae bacterium]|nr:phosphatidylglycerol lysyltransferase domain-containing protein [Gracilibacteraceae bacterium]
MNFKLLGIDDCALLGTYLARRERTACQENMATIFNWGSRLQTHLAVTEEWLFLRHEREGNYSFYFPLGAKESDLAAAANEMRAWCHSRGQSLTLWSVTTEQKNELEIACPGVFDFMPARNSWDYVYEAKRLAEVRGNKMHGKKNHLNHFIKKYPDWQFEVFGEENFDAVSRMNDEWCLRYGCGEQESLRAEYCAVQRCLANYRALGVLGGVLRAEGAVAAFSLASPLGRESFDVHVEKAFHDMQGAYQVINREMVRLILRLHPEVKWINREDDAGEEGLRQAKLSYHPDMMVEKYVAKERDK